MQFTGEVTSVVVEINIIGRLRQLSEPRLRQQAGIEKSQTPVERDILVQWVREHDYGSWIIEPVIHGHFQREAKELTVTELTTKHVDCSIISVL